MSTMHNWTPSSWKDKRINPYAIEYPDDQQKKAHSILYQLGRCPPLVTSSEISDLRNQLREVAAGQRFIWQCGDCAELFDYCEARSIEGRVQLLYQLGLLFTHLTTIPTLLIGRMAGQYGKPRNGLKERINGVETQKFHGDIINSVDVTQRDPDPERLLAAYLYSGCTLNYMRSLQLIPTGVGNGDENRGLKLKPGLDLDHPIGKVHGITMTDRMREYHRPLQHGEIHPSVFTSHEGLFIHYEQALTRPWPGGATKYFNSSAHFLWIGDKTRQLDGAHVEYFRGLENPIGIKVGPSMRPDELVGLLDVVNAAAETGKVVLISRLGKANVSQLDSLIPAVQRSKHRVVWQCDPMHGNTRVTSTKIRTRDFSSIMDELIATMDAHRRHGSWLGGVHLETTPDDGVVECVGGTGGLQDGDIGGVNYTTACDPRCNRQQALEVAFLVGRHYAQLWGSEQTNRAKL